MDDGRSSTIEERRPDHSLIMYPYGVVQIHLVSPTRRPAVDALGAPSPPRAPPNGPFAGRAASGRSRLGLGSRRAASRARATRPPRARADRLLRPRSLRDALAPCSAESGTNRSGRRQTLQYTYTRFPYPLPGATTGTKDMASAFSQRRWQSCGVASRQLLQGGSNGAESCSGRVAGGNEAACTDSLTAAPSNGLYLAGKCGDGGVLAGPTRVGARLAPRPRCLRRLRQRKAFPSARM